MRRSIPTYIEMDPTPPGFDGHEVAWHPDGEDVPTWFYRLVAGVVLGLLTVVLLFMWPIVIDSTPGEPVHTPTTYGPPPTGTVGR